jgi:hypothetical protein
MEIPVRRTHLLHNLLEGKIVHLYSAIEVRYVPVEVRQDLEEGLTLQQLSSTKQKWINPENPVLRQY